MALRPTDSPAWCTHNDAGRVVPPTSAVQTGYVPGQAVPAEWLNSQLGTVGEWITYLDSQNGGLQLASTLDSSCRLVSNATFAWDLASRRLSWDGALFVAIPGQADAANVIAAGSAIIPSGSVAFVRANVPFSTTAHTTEGSAELSSVLYADFVSVGMAVAGAGITPDATVVAVDTDGQTVTMSTPATATAQGQVVTFSSSGTLTVSVQPSETFVPVASDIIIARGTEQSCWVGINAATLRLHDKEAKQLGEDAYLSLTRPTAGAALSALQAVYISQGADDTDATGATTGRIAGRVYPADASAGFRGRSGVAGFVASAYASGATAQLVSSGILTGLSGLLPGSVYYLSATTPGAITVTPPTAAGTTAVPVGTALSATRLLINPAAASQAKANSANLTLTGTLTANSVVSAQGFRQQVKMGSLYIRAGSVFPSAPNPNGPVFEPQPLQESFPIYQGPAANTARTVWIPGAAGSIVNLQFCFSVSPGTNVPLLVSVQRYEAQRISPATLFSFSNATYVAGNAAGMFFPIAKGVRPFNAFDGIGVSVAFDRTFNFDIIVSCTMTVEMGA